MTGDVAKIILRLLARPICAASLAMALTGCAGQAGLDASHEQRVAQDPGAMFRIAAAAEKSGDLAGAEVFYRRAANLRPNFVEAQIGDARTLALQGKIDDAVVILDAAHRQNPRNNEVTKILGQLLVVDKRPSDAAAVFKEGLSDDPHSVPLLVGEGVALDSAGRHSEAQQAYKTALLMKPDDATARKDLALSESLESQAQ